MAKKETKSPYGWLNYRQNLLVLYDDVLTADPDKSDDKVAKLFADTDFAAGAERPGFAQQWAVLNEIELRLFRLLDGAILKEETERKFDNAEAEGVVGVPERRARFAATKAMPSDKADVERRAIAVALLEDLFVRYSYRFSEREKRVEVSKRLTCLGLGIIGIPTLLVFLWPVFELLTYFLGNAKGLLGRFEAALEKFAELRWTSREYAAFFVVMYFGAVGAYFSRLFIFARDIRALKWNEMDALYSRSALWVRLLVGAIAAVIVFFLMMGDILSGVLFLEGRFELWVLPENPVPDAVSGKVRPIVPFRPTEDFARLVVWCALAGFSERFLPDRFGEIEKGAGETGKRDDA